MARKRLVVVGQRFAHAHEDDVGHRLLGSLKRSTCSTISPASRLRAKPNWPVTQKTQPMAQPAWVETQIVLRPPSPGGRVHLDGFDLLAVVQAQQQLGGQAVDRLQAPDFLAADQLQAFAQGGWQVGHALRIEDAAAVDPVEELACAIGRLAPGHDELFQLVGQQAC